MGGNVLGVKAHIEEDTVSWTQRACDKDEDKREEDTYRRRTYRRFYLFFSNKTNANQI